VKRLKVLFVTNWYPTLDHPVRAVWVREHAKAVRLYDDVVVLHCRMSGPAPSRRRGMEPETDERVTEGIPTYRVWSTSSSIPAVSYLIALWTGLRAFRRLVRQGFRPDIVHAHVYDAGGLALLIGRLHRIPVVVSEHFSSFPRRTLGRLDVLKAWLAFRGADVVLPVSQALQAAIARYGIRARFRVIPNVVDTAFFTPPDHPRPDATGKRILAVGQLVPARGLAYLLQALAGLGATRADWHLDVVGEGAARHEYEDLAARLKLDAKVAFHGLKSKREVADLMRRADLFVLPSLLETFSAPVAEALATGTPILATRCGGPEEFVGEDVGLLVPTGDVEGLSTGLEYMLANVHRYSRARIAAYARERFSPEVVGARLHTVYQSLESRAASLPLYSTAMRLEPITGPAAWRGEAMARTDEWIHHLSPRELDELHEALGHVRSRGLDVIQVTRGDFPLPTFGATLDAIRGELLHGRGFVLLRGLPVDRYPALDVATIYWGIGTYFGTPRSQNAQGHLLGHVRDVGRDASDPNARVYQTSRRQNYHTDSVDIVALLCWRKARSGGLSSIISSVTAYNEMLARRPDLVPVMSEPFPTDRRGEVPAGMKGYFMVPAFNHHAGRLSVIYVRRYIESSQRFPDAPRLTAQQREAMDVFDGILEDPALHLFMDFEPGDVQLLHNHQILHDRTEFVDWPEPERKRHLLRLWLCPPDGRPLPACFSDRYGGVEIGNRGGIVVAGTTSNVPLEELLSPR